MRDEQIAALLAWATVASNSGKPKRHKMPDFLLWSDAKRLRGLSPDVDWGDDDDQDDDQDDT